MQYIVSTGNGVRPPGVGIEIGGHEFDLASVGGDLTYAHTRFFGPRKVSYCRANAPAFAQQLSDAIRSYIPRPTGDDDQTLSTNWRCHDKNLLLVARSAALARGHSISLG